ncbi:hypothetical protein [uncultured Fusobacterium sp.]|uniref:hypothetical protein n=1 Tax=uncultured Fusobacterium sp. TaxID=159267 RepID=UPI0025F4F19D|nr:hypothetical protein [uncultured Fusobacterium sp.]
MVRGGKRENSGRKKIEGKKIKVILDKEMIIKINKNIIGKTFSEKIRKCLEKGLNND